MHMATLTAAIGAAAANHGWVAARPTGLIVSPGRNGYCYRLREDKRYPWTPNVFDLVADDWQAAPLEQTRAALASLSDE